MFRVWIDENLIIDLSLIIIDYFRLQKVINESYPSKAAMEQYFLQVHALEGQLSELRTTVSGLESQLQASREEAVRWRSLAHDRLESMQKLGKEYRYHNIIGKKSLDILSACF